MHLVLLDFLGLDRPECSETDMERDKARFHAHILYLFQQLLCKMQTGSRRGCTSKLTRINGLITLRVLKLFFYIGRQRHFAELFEFFNKYALKVEFDDPVSALGNIHHRCRKLAVTECKLCSGLSLSSRPAEAFPASVAKIAQQHKLNKSAAETGSDQSCRQNSGVVHDKAVAFFQILRYIMKVPMLYRTGFFIKVQQAR